MDIFKRRRDLLCKNFKNECCLIVIDNDPERFINEDNPYPFRPGSNFYYYTGFHIPDSLMVLYYNKNKFEYHLFVKPRDPLNEKWCGKMEGLDEAINTYGADFSHDINTLTETLKTFITKDLTKIYLNLSNKREDILNLLFKVEEETSITIEYIGDILDKQRVKKDETEINVIKESCLISANAHKKLMEFVKQNMNEKELDALFTYFISIKGCNGLAYPNIVAGGNNATILHYIKNNDILKDGELLLVDAGGEYKHYAADITRTFPINGKFNEYQKNIYQLVLDTQEKCINMVKPGITLEKIHNRSVELITSGLISLGLLKGSLDECIKNESYKIYYMHSIGHWLGMDVHDCISYSRKDNMLEEGNIITIEPGIYISEDINLSLNLLGYKGIGVRIEDDILVTKDGFINLSKDAPKKIEEIEGIIGTKEIIL